MGTAEEDYAEAERRIDDAIFEGADQLDLSNLTNLTALPPEIRQMRMLKSLVLHNTEVSDIAHVQYLSFLEGLYAGNTKITDIAPLNTLRSLYSIDFTDSPVSDLSPLQNLSSLWLLVLHGTRVSDLSALAGLVNLNHLDLYNTTVADLTPLTMLKNLGLLNIQRTQVDDISAILDFSKLQYLDVSHTLVSDLRPAASMPSVPIKSVGHFGLHFQKTPAARASEKLAELAEIKDHQDRTRQTLDYLRTLPPWPEPLPWDIPNRVNETPPEAPPADSTPRITLTGAKIDVAHVPVSEADKADPVKARSYAKMQEAIGDLVRLGNRHPEINAPAQALSEILAGPFEDADLFDIHVEIAVLTDLIATNPDRPAMEQLDAESLSTLKKVTRHGPPLTLGTPEVDLFEARNAEYAGLRRAETVAYSERLLAGELARDEAPLTIRARHLAEIAANAPDEGRVAGVRISTIRNFLISGVSVLAVDAGKAIYGQEVVQAYEWALTFLTTHKDAIMMVAPSWIENGQVWAADLIARSAEMLEELRRRKSGDAD